MTQIIFETTICDGPVLVYSNYVKMEGIDMLKIYFRVIGYLPYTMSQPFHGYCEYHGGRDKADRIKAREFYNDKLNMKGKMCKVFLLSPSGSEGISLKNTRQVHLLEPYWNEVRIQQIIGRAIRQCSHKDLPQKDRVVRVFRYKMIKLIESISSNSPLDSEATKKALMLNSAIMSTIDNTADEIVEDLAKAKDNLIQSFLGPMKEVAVDCELFRNHNMINQNYKCFQFDQEALLTKNIGPAYKEDIKDDIKFDSGLNATNSHVERIRVIKIKAVSVQSIDKANNIKYSTPNTYWYHNKTGIVYDYQMKYPVGRVYINENNLPNKLDKDTYIISDLINIPTL